MKAGRQPSAQTWVLALTALASFMVALDALVVSTALSLVGAVAGMGLPSRRERAFIHAKAKA